MTEAERLEVLSALARVDKVVEALKAKLAADGVKTDKGISGG